MSQKIFYRFFWVSCLFSAFAVTASGQGVYEAWVARFDGPGHDLDRATGLVVDQSGNVYVTGNTWNSASGSDFLTIKYDPDGETLWVRIYNGLENGWDGASAIALDSNGNILVTGYAASDILTIKYSPSGESLWVKRYNGPNDQEDAGEALAVDIDGNVYVFGYADYSLFPELSSFVTIKYSPNGDSLWANLYDTLAHIGDELEHNIVVDQLGNVYVTGSVFTDSSAEDYTTLKYSSTGELLWVRSYNGPGNREDHSNAIALDDSGNVYVTGESEEIFENDDYATIKYSPDGDLLWLRRYNGPQDEEDYAEDIAISKQGYVYVTGNAGTIKYFSSGDTVWVRDQGGKYMALDSGGNIYIASEGLNFTEWTTDYQTLKYSSEGVLEWLKTYDGPDSSGFSDGDEPADVVVDASDNVYVTGFSSDGSNYSGDFLTIKYFPCSAVPGDVDGTLPIDLPDVIHLVNFVFDKDRPATSCLGADPDNCWTPDPLCQGEVNGTPPIGLPDIIHLVNFVFDKDRPATSCLGSDPGSCWTPVATEACCLPVP